jgi:Bacterial regulatory proteins, gntR family
MAITCGVVMTAPDRDQAEAITLVIDRLLGDGHLLPPGLAVTLRAYREHLLRHCARQSWAQPGNRARYARLAGTLAGNITDGTWQPGDRLPWLHHLAEACHVKPATARSALFLLLVCGHLGHDRSSYYVLPTALAAADEADEPDSREVQRGRAS